MEIKKAKKEVMKTVKHKMNDYMKIQRDLETAHKVRNLEKRLDVMTNAFNMVTESNAKLREEVDHRMKEYSDTSKFFQTLLSTLSSGKKVLVDLTEQAILTYDQLKEGLNKKQTIENQGRQDLLDQSHEMQELQLQLNHTKELHEYLEIKAQDRDMSEIEAEQALKKCKYREKYL